jgi:sirohydrochlorin cobaltochelatase
MIVNVEGYPEMDDVLEEIKEKFTEVTMIPLMMVAGDHAINDMAGDEEDSFKCILEAEGIKAMPVLRGMGENPEIGELFVKRIETLLAY